tara:strand:+ start:878 stop:1420 length:543 start_codon:yes stop_codon:yes gene_type:complete
MRFNNSTRAIPFITTILLILFLSFSNQKENTKLRILIWNTPSLSLGNYIAISTSTGFILGYSINVIIEKLINSKAKKQSALRFNNQNTQTNDDIDKPTRTKYDNTLIERDIKDPSPTITANFRIISREVDDYNEFVGNNVKDDDLLQTEVQKSKNYAQNKPNNNENSKLTDWFDQSFSDW